MESKWQAVDQSLIAASAIPEWTGRPSTAIFLFGLLISALLVGGMPWHERINIPLTVVPYPYPQSVVSERTGRIGGVTVKNGDMVSSGEVIAVLGEGARVESADEAEAFADDALRYLNGGTALPRPPAVILDEQTQSAFNDLNAALAERVLLNEYPLAEQRGARSLQLAGELRSKLQRLRQQITVQESLISLSRDRLNIQQQLSEKGWVSKDALTVQKQQVHREVLAKAKLIEEADLYETGLKSALADRAQLKTEDGAQKERADAEARRSVFALKSALASWRRSNVIRASVGGIVKFPRLYEAGQMLQAGQELAVIIPPVSGYRAIGDVPPTAHGAVHVGASLRISLPSHPAAKFGYLEAKVTDISDVKPSGSYEIGAKVPKHPQTVRGYAVRLRGRERASGEIMIPQGRLYEVLIGKLIYGSP